MAPNPQSNRARSCPFWEFWFFNRDLLWWSLGAAVFGYRKREDRRAAFARRSFERNVIYAGGELLFQAPQGAIAWMPGNVLFSRNGKVDLLTLGDYQARPRATFQVRDGTVIEDPLLLDANGGQDRFALESPAWLLGIHRSM